MADLKVKAIIIIGKDRYEKDVKLCELAKPIWKICTETQKQILSEQWLFQNKFIKINPCS